MASIDLCRSAAKFAEAVLKDKGCFVTKVIDGAMAVPFRRDMEMKFGKVRIYKPEASRKESRETYYICTQYLGKDRRPTGVGLGQCRVGF